MAEETKKATTKKRKRRATTSNRKPVAQSTAKMSVDDLERQINSMAEDRLKELENEREEDDTVEASPPEYQQAKKPLAIDIAEAVEMVEPETKQEVKTDTKLGVAGNNYKTPGRKWWMVVAGLGLIVVAFIAGAAWGQSRGNMLFALVVIALLPAGVLLIRQGLKVGESEAVIVGPGGVVKKFAGPANSLNIYAKKRNEKQIVADRVAFEWMDNPLGQPQQCINDGKWYHVHLWLPDTLTYEAFILPDSQYFDPREFANVITMPAHRKLFESQASLLQKIAPWVMVVAFLISIIGLIAMTPS